MSRGAATMTHRMRRLGMVVALAAGSAALAPGHAGALPPGAPKIGNVQTPDGNSVFMWSYANGDAPDNGLFQSPGPNLCVTQGQTVVINLTNTLPEPTSIVFPGQDTLVTAS